MTPNCRGMQTDLFYEQANWAQCREICKGCPILEQCRLDFLEDGYAFAGGMSPWQREEWRRKQPDFVPKVRSSNGSNTPISDLTKAEVVRLFDEENLSQDAIARRTGISKSATRRILQANGRSRTLEQQMELSRRRGEETLGWVLKLIDEGYTDQEAAEKVGITSRYVRDLRRKNV